MTNLNYLRYFYICAQCGTFTKAAEKLRISQPSLSMQIKTFEEQLGFNVFVRSGRSIQLTPRGQGLFIYASKIFEITDDMEKYLNNSEPTEGLSLKIGVSNEVERPFIAEVVGRLIRAHHHKKLTPSILSNDHEVIVDDVVAEKIDLVITNKKSSELKLICAINIPVMLISSVQNSNIKSSPSNLQNTLKLIDQGLILPTNEMILAKETKSFLKEKNVITSTVLTSNIIACISRAVIEGLGASFLPITYVQKELKNKTLYAYGPKDGFWMHNLFLYTYRGNENTFVSSLSKIFQDFNALKFDTELKIASTL